jgi:anti-sigma B factor antagonist
MRIVKMHMKPLTNRGALFILEGELDDYTGPQVREDLSRATQEGRQYLFVDLSGVHFLDSVGVGILVGAAKRAAEVEGDLSVVAPRANVLRVFEVSGTRDLLNVVESMEEAQERLGVTCSLPEEAK